MRKFLILIPLLLLSGCGYPDVPVDGPVAGTETSPNTVSITPTPVLTGDDFNLGKNGNYVKLPDGLQFLDLKVGTGAIVKKDDTANVQYTGWLTDGKKFDSSRDSKKAFAFKIGAGQVIPGWDEGVPGMAVGGMRRLIIPSALAYGPKGQGTIPGNADLVFLIELESSGGSASLPNPNSTSTTVKIP